MLTASGASRSGVILRQGRTERPAMRARLAIMIAMVALFGAAAAVAASSDDAFTAFAKGDYKTASKLMVPLADAGDVRAQYNLGTMYNNALGVRQDYKEAAKWLSM